MRPRVLLPVLLVFAPLAVTGCGGATGSGPSSTSDDRLRVVTTVAPITSIAANIGGDRVQITGLVPEGTNSHTFEPAPSASAVLSEADVVFINGLSLEEPTRELAEQTLGEDAEIVEIGPVALPRSESVSYTHLTLPTICSV